MYGYGAANYMKEKQDFKTIAEIFGMKLYDFAPMIGYTKQGLYQINNKPYDVNKKKYYKAMKLLKEKSDKMFESDMRRAMRKRRVRETTIVDMCESVDVLDFIEKLKIEKN